MVIPDDDRLTDPLYLIKARRLFAKYPSVRLVFANYVVVTDSVGYRQPIQARFPEFVSGRWLLANYNKELFGIRGIGIPHLTAVFARDAYLGVNGFDLECLSPDTYLWLKLLLHHDAGFVPDLVAEYHVHGGNLTGVRNADAWRMDTHIADHVRAFAHKTGAYAPSIGRTLKRMDRIFSSRFNRIVFENIRTSGLSAVPWLLRVRWGHFAWEKLNGVGRCLRRTR